MCMYSLNSRAEWIWERIELTMECEGNGVLEELTGRIWEFGGLGEFW